MQKLILTGDIAMDEKELLYEITCLHSRQFSLAMKDEWNNQDFMLDRELSQEISKLESAYKTTYGDLPEWGNSIEKIWEIKSALKRELNK